MKAFDMISFVKDMNSMFTKIQALIDQFAFHENPPDIRLIYDCNFDYPILYNKK